MQPMKSGADVGCYHSIDILRCLAEKRKPSRE